MNVGAISIRYARALLMFATEQGVEDAAVLPDEVAA